MEIASRTPHLAASAAKALICSYQKLHLGLNSILQNGAYKAGGHLFSFFPSDHGSGRKAGSRINRNFGSYVAFRPDFTGLQLTPDTC
jgi:hypothetical protein